MNVSDRWRRTFRRNGAPVQNSLMVERRRQVTLQYAPPASTDVKQGTRSNARWLVELGGGGGYRESPLVNQRAHGI